MFSLTLDRTSLSLAPLVITDHPGTGNLYLPEDGLTWPAFGTRYTRAPDSAYESGSLLLAAVREATDLPLTVYAHADTTTALDAAKAELEAAVAQWSYALTLTVDSVAHPFNAEIVLGVPWGPIDSGMVRAHMARATFSIPLNP